jgi:hypothetical protein
VHFIQAVCCAQLRPALDVLPLLHTQVAWALIHPTKSGKRQSLGSRAQITDASARVLPCYPLEIHTLSTTYIVNRRLAYFLPFEKPFIGSLDSKVGGKGMRLSITSLLESLRQWGAPLSMDE